MTFEPYKLSNCESLNLASTPFFVIKYIYQINLNIKFLTLFLLLYIFLFFFFVKCHLKSLLTRTLASTCTLYPYL